MKLKNTSVTFFIIITAIFAGICAQIAYAAEDSIECDGDQVEYFETEKKVVGSGDVVIKYKDMKLTCDRVTVWTETQEALAEGNAVLTQGEDTFEGERIAYNFKESTGEITDFKGHSDLWYIRGKEAERVSEEEFVVKKSYITTCDHEIPHWKLSADRVEIYPGKSVNTYNAVMWANPLSIKNFNIPVFWVPYYCHPLDDDRPHVTVIPGKSKDWGLYLLTAWRYDLAPNQKGYVHIDYREKQDLGVGLDYKYDTKVIGNGIMTTYYTNERDLNRDHFYDKWYKSDEGDTEPTTEKEKGMLRIRHQWQATPQTLVTAEFNKYKDEYFLKDYFYDDWEKDEHPATYALASHTMSFGNLSLEAKKRVNRFDTVTELLPQGKLDIYKQRIGSSDFFYSGNFSAVNMNQVYPRHTDEDPGTIPDPQHVNIYDSYNQLTFERKLAFLSVNPYIGTKQTYTSREIDTDTPVISGAAYAGFDVSTKFFKVFDVHSSFLGIDINRLRHIITPTLSYNHIAPPTAPPGKMLSGGVSRLSSMSFGLENKLQTKSGKDGDQVRDLAMLLVNTGYDFNHTPGGQLTDYTTKLELKPYNWLTMTSNAVINPHKLYHHEWLAHINNNVSFNFGKNGSFGLGHSYYSGSNNIIMQAKLDMIPGWKFSIYEDFDVLNTRRGEQKKNDLKHQEYVITKDLHCWEVDVRYDVDRDEGEEIMVIFRLKAFPNIPFEFGKSYHKPKIGTQAYPGYKN